MRRGIRWEYPSLAWIHRVREEHYHQTKGLPVEQWLRSLDVEKVVRAARGLGLRVRLPRATKRRTA
jgi:hypothetical protein